MTNETGRYKIGVDIGGTFTDIAVLAGDGTVYSHKLSSTPEDYSIGIANGIKAILTENGLTKDAAAGLIHATTVATNTILEYKGAKTALVTTEGFRDVLEMRRLRIPVIYDLRYRKPKPLVPRRRRYEIPERLDASGTVIRAFHETDVEAVAEHLRRDGVDSVAICLLHAYANPEPERRIAEILTRALGPDVYVSRSSEVLPEIREYERASTTVVNCYIGPIIGRYLRALSDRLADIGLKCPIQIMHSGGGVMSVASAIDKPAHLVESGPAAGVIACARVAEAVSRDKAISFDMGGTTAKAALVEDGVPTKTAEYEVGSGINLSSKLVKGGGYPIKLPFIDVSEIGAGGGSIVSVDHTGRVSVGPESAGASPGPVAYMNGGTDPTFTDALIVLGYISPSCLVGGEFQLDPRAARDALQTRVATPLGKSLEETAHGILTLGVATMTRAIKAVSTYQGRDPREFTLVAFGGNGPVVAAEVAKALQMTSILVPPAPGVLSAVGLLFSDVEHTFTKTIFARATDVDAAMLKSVYAELAEDAARVFAADGYPASRLSMRAYADLRYAGQSFELTVPTDVAHPDIERLKGGFVAEHNRTYGHGSDTDPIDIINLRLLATLDRDEGARDIGLKVRQGPPGTDARPVHFGADYGTLSVPVIARSALSAAPRQGPLVVEEYDSTCIVPPYASASLDHANNILMELEVSR